MSNDLVVPSPAPTPFDPTIMPAAFAAAKSFALMLVELGSITQAQAANLAMKYVMLKTGDDLTPFMIPEQVDEYACFPGQIAALLEKQLEESHILLTVRNFIQNQIHQSKLEKWAEENRLLSEGQTPKKKPKLVKVEQISARHINELLTEIKFHEPIFEESVDHQNRPRKVIAGYKVLPEGKKYSHEIHNPHAIRGEDNKVTSIGHHHELRWKTSIVPILRDFYELKIKTGTESPPTAP